MRSSLVSEGQESAKDRCRPTERSSATRSTGLKVEAGRLEGGRLFLGPGKVDQFVSGFG